MGEFQGIVYASAMNFQRYGYYSLLNAAKSQLSHFGRLIGQNMSNPLTNKTFLTELRDEINEWHGQL